MTRRSGGSWFLALPSIALLAAIQSGSAIEAPLDPEPDVNVCALELSPLVEVAIDRGSDPLRLGDWASVSVDVTPSREFASLRLRLETEGPVSLGESPVLDLGFVSAGETVPLPLPVRYDGAGEAAVHVWVDALDEGGRAVSSHRETLYAVVTGDAVYAETGDFQQCHRAAILEREGRGELSAEEARHALQGLAEAPFTSSKDAPTYFAPSPSEQALNDLVGAPTEGHLVEPGPGPALFAATPDTIDVQGNVQWTDENGMTHPVFGATVSIRDDDGIFGTEIITAVVTDTNGNYFATVDTDDGPFQGDRDIFVVVRAANGWVDTQTTGGDTYVMTSGVHDETPGGSTITENFTAANNGGGEAFSVFQAGTWIAAYTTNVNGGALPQVVVEWPNGDTKSFFGGGKVRIEQPDRWDWDTIHHEYGHYVASILDIEDNPGGPHNIGDCISDVAPSMGSASKSRGVRLAWGEGWPTYFGTSGQQVLNMAALNVPRVGDVLYQDLEDGSLTYSLETQDSNGLGEDNEVAVQRLLWDLFDTNSDGRDSISRSHANIWTTIDGANPKTLSAAWAALRSGQSNAVDLLMGEIASDHVIGPRLIAPSQGALITPSGANFAWNRDVGCSATYDGDDFDLVFYNASTNAKILTVSGLTSPSASLSLGQFQTLTASSHQVKWAVEGSNTSSPATGPYLGESFDITVNQPPTANAGPDQSVECSSHTTTPVLLNGTGSSDPDGDALTYSWSAAGVSFSNPSSATPIGAFPKGTTVVTLTVSDGFHQDMDTVVIHVIDTTPPVISCPADITVECTQHGGTPANDPQLAPFFAGVSATDVCDLNPTITNDAPLFFPLGETLVTFTATDADGNASSCARKVVVQDTTPPVIQMSLDKTFLWPPNHKLVDIVANVTVEDICDPNPTFVLTSITSNEPDNGLGDGDTVNDIQGAAFGTADVSFQLRAERSGKGNGRIYTVTYTASDMSGNTAQAKATVLVPHSGKQ